MKHMTSILKYALPFVVSLGTAVMSATVAAQARSASAQAGNSSEKSGPVRTEKNISIWHRLGDRTNQDGDTLEIWTGRDQTAPGLPDKTAGRRAKKSQASPDLFVMVKRSNGVITEIALGKLVNKSGSGPDAAGKKPAPVDFAALMERGVITSTVTLGPRRGRPDPYAKAGSTDHGEGGAATAKKTRQPTVEQLAALNGLFHAIRRSDAVMNPSQASGSGDQGNAPNAK